MRRFAEGFATRTNLKMRIGGHWSPSVRTALLAMNQDCRLEKSRCNAEIAGHEIEHPMAMVIPGGLATSTFLTLFVMPTLYLRSDLAPSLVQSPDTQNPPIRDGGTMLGSRSTRIVIGALLIAILGVSFYWLTQNPTVGAAIQYNPPFDPSNFVPQITNKYFTLEPGAKFTYMKKTTKGLERSEVVVLKETKEIMGVTTIVVWDRVWLNDKLKEDTRDWYAQDRDGNVWYFGEAVGNYKNGKLNNYAGTWEAGADGAKPGIIMPASPKVGFTYQQEHAKGKAEDMGTIIATGKRIEVPLGTFDDCVQTRDWSRIEKTANEYKYYCPAVGFVVLEESAWLGASLLGDGKTELVSVSRK